jgi:hypothetical protein
VVSLATDEFDLVAEGNARQVTDTPTVMARAADGRPFWLWQRCLPAVSLVDGDPP